MRSSASWATVVPYERRVGASSTREYWRALPSTTFYRRSFTEAPCYHHRRMRTVRSTLVLTFCCVALAACDNPLIGDWTNEPIPFSQGGGSGTYVQTWTFDLDARFEVRQVATYTSGEGFEGCVTTSVGTGTYQHSDSDGTGGLTLHFGKSTIRTTDCVDRDQNDRATRLMKELSGFPTVPGGGNLFSYVVADDTLSLTLAYGTVRPVTYVYFRE